MLLSSGAQIGGAVGEVLALGWWTPKGGRHPGGVGGRPAGRFPLALNTFRKLSEQSTGEGMLDRPSRTVPEIIVLSIADALTIFNCSTSIKNWLQLPECQVFQDSIWAVLICGLELGVSWYNLLFCHLGLQNWGVTLNFKLCTCSL